MIINIITVLNHEMLYINGINNNAWGLLKINEYKNDIWGIKDDATWYVYQWLVIIQIIIVGCNHYY